MDIQQRDVVSVLQSGAAVWNAWRRAVKLAKPDLAGADLSYLDLSGTNLKGANLHGADLHETNFAGARLTGARMTGCDARSALFIDARMGGADLTGADLRGARFDFANLRDARLDGARLDGAAFEGADVTGLTGAPPDGLPGAVFDLFAPATKGNGSLRPALGQVMKHRLATHLLRPFEVDEVDYVSPESPRFRMRTRDAAPARAPDTDRYTVHFATNRAPRDPTDLSLGFGSDRSAQVHYGTASVLVPESHRIGEIDGSWWRQLVGVLTGRRAGLALEKLLPASEEGFWTAVTNILGSVPEAGRDAVVFLHGYNTTFHNAVLRAAQIGCDLKLPMMGLFSWPSQGDLKGYPADEAAIEASERAIAEFLANMADRAPTRRVHVLAHSMGNRGVLRSLSRIMKVAGRFGQFVLAAPDVDRDLFLQHAGEFGRFALRTTVYASDADVAVGASRFVHQFPRVGFVPPVTVAPGIDTIHVPKIDLTLLGHGYAASVRSVLTDISEMIRHNTAPDGRIGLHKMNDPAGIYWRFGR